MTSTPEAVARAASVRTAVGAVLDPEIRRPLSELDMIGEVAVEGASAQVALRLTILGCPAADAIAREVRSAALAVPGVEAIDLDVSVMTPAERETLVTRLRGTRPRQFGPDSLTRVIAVTSGKGGVGKSSVTANLAVDLAARGLAVGVLDADVFGFSIPGMLGIPEARPTKVGDMILPPVLDSAGGGSIRVISIGMFLDPGGSRAVSWRGPLLHRTMQQFLSDVWWGDLDTLLLDLPPGTGDVAISLGQLLPGAEVLVVTTPQPAAADVAERSGLVARQTGQRVIGVVENMVGGLFGSGGGDEVAGRLGAPVLARIPLSVPLRAGGDAGDPVVRAHPDDAASAAIAALTAAVLATGRPLAGRALPFTVA
ncbi:MAG: P-loop NTPase [Micrococcales bacterium]|nr:P-loop NTPase [Micrococcales bacterium]